MNFEIRAISFEEISSFISDDRWEEAGLIPITPERARSQQMNPNALAAEPCLWVAFSPEEEVVGFAGSLPGYDVHNRARIGWNTCWWVDPECGKESSLPLFFSFLQHWDQRVAFADLTAHTHAIIRQLDFCHTRKEKLLQGYVRVPGSKLRIRLGFAGKILWPVLLPAVVLVNRLQQFRLEATSRRNPGVDWETREQLDEELYDFISRHRKDNFLHRSLEEYRWIEQHPWLVTGSPETRGIASNYPFSWFVEAYRVEWLVTRKNHEISSVMMVSVRDGTLKVLYFFGLQPMDAMRALSRRISGDSRVYSFIVAHQQLLSSARQAGPPVLMNRSRERYVGVSKKLMDSFPEDMVIQLGDGDSVFT